jgi:hypothetical protein
MLSSLGSMHKNKSVNIGTLETGTAICHKESELWQNTPDPRYCSGPLQGEEIMLARQELEID